MKLTIVFLLTFFLQQGFSANAQHLNISKKDATLLSILKEIRAQSGYDFFFEETSLENAKQVSIHVKDGTLEEVLAVSFKNQPFTYSITKNAIVIKNKPLAVIKQEAAILQNDIKGTVVDENGVTLPGATVQVKGTQKTVMTNANGEFEIKDVDNNATLVISFMGYKSKEVLASKASGTIKLEVNSNELEEVGIMVSTGYQKIPKERATGSFSMVTADDMKGKLQANIMDRIEGMLPGLTTYKGKVNIRGTSTLNGDKKPLIVVDGVPFEGDIENINPSDIESINILKDATAASIYGARSANGVMVITTKSGKAGPLRVAYDASVKFTPLPDRDYANKMSSSELVNFQKEMFGYRSGDYAAIDPRKSMNDVYKLLYEHREGNLTDAEFESALDVYRNQDRYDQVVDEFLNKVGVLQQHNLGFSGGTEFHRYNLSGNYLASNPNEKSQSSRKIGFNLRNSFKFTDWFSADLGILGANNKSDNNIGILGMDILNKGKASYFMLRDANGNPAEWMNNKSRFEINRLVNDEGLLDETYIPLNELNKRHLTNNSNYINFNLGAQFKLYDGLSLDLRYQNERTDSYKKDFYKKDAYKVKTQINDATVLDKANNRIINYIPKGGQIGETRGELNSHTLRAQLNYSNLFNSIHQVDIIAGAEQRKIVGTNTSVYRYGYDDYSLNFVPIDEIALNSLLYNTQSIFGTYSFKREGNGFGYTDDRFVSFYGNGSYTYDRKLTASASIRMDQSNLFGTDPKYQYRPLWSTGLLYVISQNEIDWLDRLAVRTTYGINGSIPKESGPYMITQSNGTNSITNEPQDYVSSPPNSGLRWEKTKVTNFGLDFKMFRNTFSGSIDVYNKSTSDLLGNRLSDPTIGWSSVIVNYGDMNNKGVELALNREHMNTMDFRWSSTLNFSYNKNKVTRLENTSETIYSYLYEGEDRYKQEIGQNRVGKPMNAMYSIRYGGLDAKGKPIALKKDGTQVMETGKLSAEDLIYEGTGTPPFAASLQNNLSYKNFDLFFMFTYYGGHVMRNVMSPYLTKYAELNYTSNIDKLALNYWKKPGDELIPGIAPGFNSGVGTTITNIWEGGNQHIQKGDYIKLRDVTLSYNLASEALKKYHVQGVRFSLQVQNAWRWAANDLNLDPEVWTGTKLMPSRGDLLPPTYTFGLSVNF